MFVESAKTYCATTNDHISHFKNVYRDRLHGTRVMHDDGNEFKIKGESILGDGADREFVFTPATHGEESVLDNNWFAVAKNWWRAEREKYCGKDIDKQSVYLLYCIDYYKSGQISRLYDRNFLLDQEKLTLARVDDFLKQTTRMTFENQIRSVWSDMLQLTKCGARRTMRRPHPTCWRPWRAAWTALIGNKKIF